MGQMSGPNDVSIHSTAQTTLMPHGPLRRSDRHEKDPLSLYPDKFRGALLHSSCLIVSCSQCGIIVYQEV